MLQFAVKVGQALAKGVELLSGELVQVPAVEPVDVDRHGAGDDGCRDLVQVLQSLAGRGEGIGNPEEPRLLHDLPGGGQSGMAGKPFPVPGGTAQACARGIKGLVGQFAAELDARFVAQCADAGFDIPLKIDEVRPDLQEGIQRLALRQCQYQR